MARGRGLPRFYEAYPALTNFATIAGVLRLSTKYEVEHLRRRVALVHLSSEFPTKLVEWDAERDRTDPLCAVPLWNRSSWEYDPNLSAANSLIDLCRETQAPWVILIVIYMLGEEFECPADIFHGDPSLDTSTHVTRPGLLRAFCTIHIDGCTSRKRCAEEKLAALNDVHGDYDRYPVIPLDIWGEEDWSRLSALCTTCLRELRKAHQQARQDLWTRLPEMYSLSPWEELEKLKAAAIGVV
ncbi:hypothetical protein B0H19DRAFT_1077043 [Mycena capillaripes]|nr:hypothetical protein B0H19DRAFT_1077043 [Mycena capillaripes]